MLRGWKNRPAPLPGRVRTRGLNQALSVISLSLEFLSVSMVLLTMVPFALCYFVLFVYSVSWLFLLDCQQGCSPRDRGLGLESTRDRFFPVLVLVLVLALPVLTTSLIVSSSARD